jgi:Holliday junction resolvasome RuvABC DNA-binding subunit
METKEKIEQTICMIEWLKGNAKTALPKETEKGVDAIGNHLRFYNRGDYITIQKKTTDRRHSLMTEKQNREFHDLLYEFLDENQHQLECWMIETLKIGCKDLLIKMNNENKEESEWIYKNLNELWGIPKNNQKEIKNDE